MANNVIKDYFGEIAEMNGLVLFDGFGHKNSLFCADIMDNVKKDEMHLFACIGEHHLVVYDNDLAMHCFTNHVCNVISNGQDFEYQPLMKYEVQEEKTSVLCITNSAMHNMESSHSNCRIINECDTYKDIIQHINDNKDISCVIINDISPNTDTIEIFLNELDKTAKENNIIIISGLKIPPTCDLETIYKHIECKYRDAKILRYFHNDNDEYCTLTYTTPGQKTIPFKIEGNKFVPSRKFIEMRYRSLFEKYANIPTDINILTNIIYGALNGDFQKKSIMNAINEAIDNGILAKNGKKVTYTHSQCKTNPNKGNIAITAMGYEEGKNKNRRLPFAYFGQAKFVIGEHTKNIIGAILKCILSNKVNMKFKRQRKECGNILIFALGIEAERIISYTEKLAQNNGYKGKIIGVQLQSGISENDMKSSFETETNKHRPDYVFVFEMNKINFEEREHSHIFSDISEHAKANGFACFANVENGKYREFNDLCYDVDGNFIGEQIKGNIYQYCEYGDKYDICLHMYVGGGVFREATYEEKLKGSLMEIFSGLNTYTEENEVIKKKHVTIHEIIKALSLDVLTSRKINGKRYLMRKY